jgi:transposase
MISQTLLQEAAMDVKDHLPLSELKRLERVEKDADRAKRLRIIILGQEGWTAPAVAMAVGLSRRICQRWVRRYNDEGLAGLDDQRGRASKPPLTPEQQDQMRRRLDAGPTAEDEVCSLRAKDVQRILAQEFQLLRSLPFGQQGTTTNVWARKGSRPTAIRQTEYEYLWVLGAVCPETGHAEGLLSPQLNAKIVTEFLRQFSSTIPPGEHAVMLWDGAGFHASKQLRVPDNVTVVTLPPYSPELNPIENLWHYLKSHCWSNRAYDDYDALEQAAVVAWNKVALDSELMKTVCAAPYLDRATSS